MLRLRTIVAELTAAHMTHRRVLGKLTQHAQGIMDRWKRGETSGPVRLEWATDELQRLLVLHDRLAAKLSSACMDPANPASANVTTATAVTTDVSPPQGSSLA
jgi:hypothetical protein